MDKDKRMETTVDFYADSKKAKQAAASEGAKHDADSKEKHEGHEGLWAGGEEPVEDTKAEEAVEDTEPEDADEDAVANNDSGILIDSDSEDAEDAGEDDQPEDAVKDEGQYEVARALTGAVEVSHEECHCDSAAVGAMSPEERAIHEEKCWSSRGYVPIKQLNINAERFRLKIVALEKEGKVPRSVLTAPWFQSVLKAVNAKKSFGMKRKYKRPLAAEILNLRELAAKERGVERT